MDTISHEKNHIEICICN